MNEGAAATLYLRGVHGEEIYAELRPRTAEVTD